MAVESVEVFGPGYREVSVGQIVTLATTQPLTLSSGKQISHFPLAYQTYGTLNEAHSNAILVCHGLTADQYLASRHPVTDKDGWWDLYVGPGKPIDTERFFVICANVLGGSMGSFGPKTTNPVTQTPLGLDFPVVTIHDMVDAQLLLLDILGINKLAAVVGGSMGGMQALSFATRHPDRTGAAMVIAASARHSAQNIAFHEIGRQAIMVDADWKQGRYYDDRSFPAKGLAVARMAAHVTYLSELGLQKKFGRGLQDRERVTYGFDADFKIESYLRHQGSSFVERFDPNSYFYITRAMDYFDLAEEHQGNLAEAFLPAKEVKFCIVSFSSDWLFTPQESRNMVRALNGVGAAVTYADIESDKGHDAFLLPSKSFESVMRGFLWTLPL